MSETQQPIYVFWDVTGKCNLSCAHCRQLSKPSKNELSLEEAFNFIDQLAEYQVNFLGLLGGEPLLRQDIFEIINYAKKRSLAVGLGTNGTLITPIVAKKIKDLNINFCFVSLDGLRKTNDSVRGKGSFDKILQGIQCLKQESVPTGIRMTLMKENLQDWKGVVDLAIDLDVELSIRRVLPCGKATENNLCLSPKDYKQEIIDLYTYAKNKGIKIDSLKSGGHIMLRNRDPVTFVITGIAYEIEKKYGTKEILAGCAAGIANCYVDSIGNLYACASLPISVGNVRDTKFKELWLNSELFRKLRERQPKGKCGLCQYKYLCGGCRASAFYSKGDYLEYDPFCMLKENECQ